MALAFPEVFPALKPLGEGRLERIFYLTARTVGRTIAEKALTDLRYGDLKLRSLTLTAKEKTQPVPVPSSSKAARTE